MEKNEIVLIKNGTAIDVFLDVKEDYPRDLWMTASIAKRDAKTKEYISMISYEMNVCQLLGRKNPNDKLNWMQVWFENYWKQGNMPRFCPIMKVRLISGLAYISIVRIQD